MTQTDDLVLAIEGLAQRAAVEVERHHGLAFWTLNPHRAASSPLSIIGDDADDLTMLVVSFGRAGGRIELGGTEEDLKLARQVISAVVGGRLTELRLTSTRGTWQLALDDGRILKGSSNWLTGWVPPWRNAEREKFEAW
jgi:hypothetical protein